ncbi:MAG TPA: Uma2 family endonuclease [Gemmatimonadales bacterium]|nr:Uma2 family endonuclease [Gemmatimonadales bacterium]
MPAPRYHTAEMVRQLPDDGNRYEVVHGELLVTPSPRPLHQRVQLRLAAALLDYLRREPVGEAFIAPADISWGADILVQPDLFVVRLDEARTSDWARMQHLLLAVEILSPSSARADRFTKRRLYQEVGVPLYWMVDCDEPVVERWTPDMTFPAFERERLAWHPDGAREPFTLELAELFRPL